MGIPKVKSHNFYFDFFEKNFVPIFYKRIDGIPKSYFNDGHESFDKPKNGVHIVNCIPPFLLNDEAYVKKAYGVFTKTYRLGYAMLLTDFSSSNEYLRHQLGKKKYKNIRQDSQRLRRDHDINSRTFYGEIDMATYEALFLKLEEFIKNRFDKQGRKHFALTKWSFYKENTYQKIIEKKASFLVLYKKDTPIGIALNFHFKKIFFAAVTSFDNTYHNYSLGKLMFVNQLEWCYKNGVHLLDTGWGEFDYKIKFSNAVYKYHTQTIFPKKNIAGRMVAYVISWALMLKSRMSILFYLKFKSPKSHYEGRWLNLEKIDALASS